MKRRSPIDANDIVALAGLASLFYGLYLLLPAVAYIALGLLLMAAGTAGAWANVRR